MLLFYFSNIKTNFIFYKFIIFFYKKRGLNYRDLFRSSECTKKKIFIIKI